MGIDADHDVVGRDAVHQLVVLPVDDGPGLVDRAARTGL
jgi:hypothetical protein